MDIEEKVGVTKTAQNSESGLVSRQTSVTPLFVAVDFDFER